MSGEDTPATPTDEGGGGALPGPTADQRARLAERLSRRTPDPADSGQTLPLTRAALALDDPVARLEAVVAALARERVVVPVSVESDPRGSGHRGPDEGEATHEFPTVGTPQGPALVAYSSAAALAADRPGARPAPVSSRTLALTALVETGGRVVLDPGGSAGDGIRLPRPAVAALGQGDAWLPAWRDADLLAGLRRVARAGEGVVLDVRIPGNAGATQRVDLVVGGTPEGRDARNALAHTLRDLATHPRLLAACERIEIVPVRAFAA